MTRHLHAALATAVGATALVVPAFAVPAAGTTAIHEAAATPAAPTQPLRRGAGRLMVTVQGLPEAVEAEVVIEGPGDFRVRVTDTAKLRGLRKGRYEVTARAVDRPNGTYRSHVADDTVQVRRNRTQQLTVTYRWDPEDTPVQATAFEADVVRWTNRARAQSQNCGKYGVKPKAPPVSLDSKLVTAARRHANDMAANSYFAHNSRNGRNPGQRMSAAGYRWSWWGENIAAGFDTPKSVVDAWVESDGHCVNLMSRNFTEIGVGYARRAGSDYGTYWVQDFARPQ